MNESTNIKSTKKLGESEKWEEAYLLNRRSIAFRRKRMDYFDWPKADAQLLDLGAGDGLDRQVILDKGFESVVSVDVSANLLGRFSGDRVLSDAHNLPFKAEGFDVVFANSILHHVDPERVFPEIAHILKPGGSFLFMEPRPCFVRKILDWLTLSFAPAQGLSFFQARRNTLTEELDVMTHWLKVYPQVKGWLEDSGFSLHKQHLTKLGVLAQWRKKNL